MADAKFIGGPLHGQRKMIPARGWGDYRVPICLPVHLRPTEAGLAQLTTHVFRYVRVDDLSDGSTLFMPEAKDPQSGDGGGA